MHLFGDSSGPHVTHFQAHRERGYVELGCDVRPAPALSWRVLRSERGFVETADALPGSGQTVVMEGTDTYLMDDQVVEGATDPVESRYEQSGYLDGEFEQALLLTSRPGTGSTLPR